MLLAFMVCLRRADGLPDSFAKWPKYLNPIKLRLNRTAL